ncbi:hypothetical protein MCG98_01565 [Ruminococcus sp. OA3]|uniref:FIST N-terminal domain-containing protein n=1 Tax=Ruminococcus sp. OA3 TaxID=2914164 RepID=UPI001F052421|nr:FIST N-terminal domain-containing protein [Ruminococcus sp. OA3]MCH1981264.1 hypothetical protein [Ruminococcus sp. OA3]
MTDEDLCVGVAAVEKKDGPEAAGERAAILAMERAGKTVAPDYVYMMAPTGEEEFYLKGITRVIGRVLFFGGSAADNTISGNWKLFTDRGVFADAVRRLQIFWYRHGRRDVDVRRGDEYQGHRAKNII